MNNYEENLKELNNFISLYKNNGYPDIEEYITNDNKFYDLYGINIWDYIRVSTTKQDFGRQIIELYEYLKKKNISIPKSNIFFDKFTGKKLNRDQYQLLRTKLKKNDYLLTTNLSRLGRNWDDVKKEWYDLEVEGVNKIILDNDNLSVELPNEKKEQVTLSKKFIQDITFSACLYSACQKIEEVSQATKDGLKKAKAKGKRLGRPAGNNSTMQNFIIMLELITSGTSKREAEKQTGMPRRTFGLWLNREYARTKTNNMENLLNILKEEQKNEE